MFQLPAKGHLAASCPHGAIFCSERQVDYKGNSTVRQAPVKQGLCVPGKVEGTLVKSVVLDTDCSRILVRSNLVPQWRGKLWQYVVLMETPSSIL